MCAFLTLEDGTDRLCRNVGKKITSTRWVITQKSAILKQVKVSCCIIVLRAVNAFWAVEGDVYAFFYLTTIWSWRLLYSFTLRLLYTQKKKVCNCWHKTFYPKISLAAAEKWKILDPVCLVAHSVFFTLSAELSRFHHQKDRLQRNIEARSRNHCCGQAISITYSACVFVVWVIQHAQRMRRILLSPVVCPALPYFSMSSDRHHLYWEKIIEYKMCVLNFCTTFFKYLSSKKNFARCFYKCTYVCP